MRAFRSVRVSGEIAQSVSHLTNHESRTLEPGFVASHNVPEHLFCSFEIAADQIRFERAAQTQAAVGEDKRVKSLSLVGVECVLKSVKRTKT